jgi:Transposase IS116/IS110/IS902 family
MRAEIAAADDAAVPAAAKQAIAPLGRGAERIEARLGVIDAQLMEQHKANPVRRRLAAIPGIGPIGALSWALPVEAAQFASARHFAAWLGLVPRECSTAGKQRLGGISRAGDERLRQLLVLGATAVIQHAKPRVKSAGQGPTGRPATSQWLLNLLSCKPRKLAAVALANKACPGAGRGGPQCVGHDDERGGVPAPAGDRLTARPPRVQGSREKMLIGRSDDPRNPCRVAASKVTFPFGSGSRNPSGASGTCRDNRPDTRPQPHRSRIFLSHPLYPGAVRTPYASELLPGK